MDKVIVFIDYANVNRAARDRNVALDYHDLLAYLSEGRRLIDAHCYFPVDPRTPHARDKEIEDLWLMGYVVHTKIGVQAGDTYKCNFDVELTMDMMRVAHQLRPDIVVLVSGDADFVPVILELRKQGIRMECAAFRENAGREAILKSSGFIDLEAYLEEAAPLVSDERAQDEEQSHQPPEPASL